MAPEKPFSVLLADYLRAALVDYNNGSAEDTRNAEDACGLVLAEYARAVNDLSEDLHSAARCGQSGPKACPGCVIDGLREELDRANTATKQVAAAAETEITRLNAALAEVRTGKSRVYDGVDRRGWTDAQWLEEARSIFYDAFGGAGDLLNGHISAMWKQLTTTKQEHEQLAAIATAKVKDLAAALGIAEIRKDRSGTELKLSSGSYAAPGDTAFSPVRPIAGHCIRCRPGDCDGCFYCQQPGSYVAPGDSTPARPKRSWEALYGGPPQEVHGWTWHGHRCCDQAGDQKPGWIPGIWKCGGSPQCPVCKTEVERMAGHREERGPHV